MAIEGHLCDEYWLHDWNVE